MNLQVTELRIGKVEAAAIEWNGAEIKASLDVALEEYRNTVVTEQTLKGSKKVMADLNKQVKAIDDFRKTTVKQLNPSIKQFETEAKELVSMIKEARTVISDQVEKFIIKQREEKKEIVESLIDAVSHEIELLPKYLERIERKDNYLNASITANKIREDVILQFNALKAEQDMEQLKIDTIKSTLDVYNEKLEFKFQASYFDYLMDNDLTVISNVVKQKVEERYQEEQAKIKRMQEEKERAIEEAKRQAELEAKREAEAARLAEEKRHQEELRQKEIETNKAIDKARATEFKANRIVTETVEQFEDIIPVETEVFEDLKEITLHVLAEQSKLDALEAYLKQFDIQYVLEV